MGVVCNGCQTGMLTGMGYVLIFNDWIECTVGTQSVVMDRFVESIHLFFSVEFVGVVERILRLLHFFKEF